MLVPDPSSALCPEVNLGVFSIPLWSKLTAVMKNTVCLCVPVIEVLGEPLYPGKKKQGPRKYSCCFTTYVHAAWCSGILKQLCFQGVFTVSVLLGKGKM